jgi:hypothetical protein
MIVAVIAILAWAAIRVARYRAGLGDPPHRHRERTASPPAAVTAREEALLGEVRELRERVKVLERIATDANSNEVRQSKAIAAEIESLREN